MNYKQRAALACNGNNLRLNAIKLDSKFQIFIFASLLYSKWRQNEFTLFYHFSVVIFQTIDLNSVDDEKLRGHIWVSVLEFAMQANTKKFHNDFELL